jgi:hypothetical protein
MSRDPAELDVRRDGLALIEACHRDDLEAARVLLDNCNPRLVAMFLARVACDVVESMTDDADAALGWLRAQHAAD